MSFRVLFVTEDAPRFSSLAGALRAAGCEIRIVAPDPARADTEADLVMIDPALSPGPLDVAERRHIATMLRHTGGNKRQAAQLLGIARSTLLAKVRKYGLDGAGDRTGEPTGGVAV
ncbi:MAG: helix-turn-helix domain-containing protein [Gemmatimonadales bacterium]